MGRAISGVCLYVFFPHNISKTDAAEITKLDTRASPGNPFIWGQKVNSQGHVAQKHICVGLQTNCNIDVCFGFFPHLVHAAYTADSRFSVCCVSAQSASVAVGHGALDNAAIFSFSRRYRSNCTSLANSVKVTQRPFKQRFLMADLGQLMVFFSVFFLNLFWKRICMDKWHRLLTGVLPVR